MPRKSKRKLKAEFMRSHKLSKNDSDQNENDSDNNHNEIIDEDDFIDQFQKLNFENKQIQTDLSLIDTKSKRSTNVDISNYHNEREYTIYLI